MKGVIVMDHQYTYYTPGQDGNPQNNQEQRQPRKKKGVPKWIKTVCLGLIFGVTASAAFQTSNIIAGRFLGTRDEKKETGKTEAVGNAKLTTSSDSSVQSDVADIAGNAMPSVVSITNMSVQQVQSFFGGVQERESQSAGSGIIIGQNDTELLIVSNYHVIADSDELTVQFVEGSEARASIKGTDPDMDLAVIAVPIGDVNSSTLQEIAVATLGNSDTLTVGEPAIAIGNSLGYGQSVTTGVISALNRSIQLSDGTDGTFIQTDAAINPGNSGGALLNMKGEVVGINSNKIGGSAVEGMGYAIPISAASPIIAELMLKETKNKVAEEERGYLGISGISVTQEVSAAYGMPEGVYISQVYENTAAAAAGLRKGDIIVEFGGDKI